MQLHIVYSINISLVVTGFFKLAQFFQYFLDTIVVPRPLRPLSLFTLEEKGVLEFERTFVKVFFSNLD